MFSTSDQRRIAGACALLLLLTLAMPGSLRGDDAADFNRLDQQCTMQCAAGNYRDAEQTAQAMLRLAEGTLSHMPLARARGGWPTCRNPPLARPQRRGRTARPAGP